MIQPDDARRKPKFIRLLVLGIGFIFLAFFHNSLMAQTADNNMAVGVGAGVFQTAEESDYEADGVPMDLYFDWDVNKEWMKFRIGTNSSQAKLEFDAYNKSWTSELMTTSVYIAYRYTHDLMETVQVFGVGGLAMMSSSLSMNHGADTVTDAGVGPILGGGAYYLLGSLGVGMQLNIQSRTGDFDGVEIATGSTQLQLAACYSF